MNTSLVLCLFSFFLGCASLLWFLSCYYFYNKPKYAVKQEISWIYYFIQTIAKIIDHLPFSKSKNKPNVEDICNQVRKDSGLSDFGDNNLWKISLQCYLDDLFDGQNNKVLYRLSAKSESIKRLTKRVRVLDAFKRFPEIENIQLPKQFFIVGMPRTGSTILHQCLCY